MDRLADLHRFYAIFARLESLLGRAPTLGDCSGKMQWPKRGVYFFRERGECRTDTGQGPRIVRVGTHALMAGSKSTLWGRLSQHKGQVTSGGGNHRGSIFRLLVGGALIAKSGLTVPSWGQDRSMARTGSGPDRDDRFSSPMRLFIGDELAFDPATMTVPKKPAAEAALELRVSEVIREMPFLWIPIDDEAGASSARGVIERNSIALLSNAGSTPLDAPSPEWLGRFSGSERVRQSGMWNQNHVSETYDPAFLDRLERLVDAVRARR